MRRQAAAKVSDQTELVDECEAETGEVKPCRNPNHPVKGAVIKVEPIRNEKDIKNIKKLLADKPRDLALFILGINTNLRASDLLRITIGHILNVSPGEKFSIREKKTGKLREITMNKTVYEAVQNLLKSLDTADKNAYLFQSRKGRAKLTEGYLNMLVKGWCNQLNLKGNFGAHSLRKTWGHSHRTRFHTDIPTLMVMFNHSSQKQTLDYLCISATDVQDAYLKEI
jgi:integrase